MSFLIQSIIDNEESLYNGDLRYYFKLAFNAPNADNPYHNFRHLLAVLCAVYDAVKFYRLDQSEGQGKVRELLIAALLHDYDHGGKLGNDELEVAIAIKAANSLILEVDRNLWPGIEHLIKATQVPYTNDNVSLRAQILRDADRSQIFSDVWLQQIVFGLAREAGESPLDWLKQEPDFLNKICFETQWAYERFNSELPDKINEVAFYLEVLCE